MKSTNLLCHSLYVFGISMLVSCGNPSNEFDATGTFEATEVTVSAQQNGEIIHLDITEGENISRNTVVGLIDTIQLSLQAKHIESTKIVLASQRPDIAKQTASTRQQLIKAQQDYDRFSGLVKDGAANQKQLDDAHNQVLMLQKQIEALTSSLTIQTNSLNAQIEAADVQVAQIAEQLRKCRIETPISGTILNKYVEAGEFATIGRPIFKIADTENMFLKAYITSSQLKDLKLGQTVKVYADFGNGEKLEYQGTVCWISTKSEFTPKTILTDDERADLVYAVKISVKNDGGIKIGMYGEVKF